LLANEGKSADAITGGMYLIPFPLQVIAEHFKDIGFIFDDDDLFLAHGSSLRVNNVLRGY
jgi:hypothetical protein